MPLSDLPSWTEHNDPAGVYVLLVPSLLHSPRGVEQHMDHVIGSVGHGQIELAVVVEVLHRDGGQLWRRIPRHREALLVTEGAVAIAWQHDDASAGGQAIPCQDQIEPAVRIEV